ncbi:HAD family hydrolase [Floccifex sp.]|uniref:HAD family hydrolase n=1 Tax=Floccifex sp. TaxID=2815810 RepID=UPI003F0E3C7A
MKLMFDCDDTLYDCQWPFKMAVNQVLKDFEIKDIDSFYDLYRKKGDEMFASIQDGTLNPHTGGILRIERTMEALSFPISRKQATDFQDTYKMYQYKIYIKPEFKKYLMSHDFEYAILTNGENTHQRNKCKALQVTDFVKEDHIFTSGEIGYAKPDPRVFEYIMNVLNQQASDWFYIGDHYKNDMEGAKNAGLKTIHFNRHHKQEGPCSDYVVYSEEELMDLLNQLHC